MNNESELAVQAVAVLTIVQSNDSVMVLSDLRYGDKDSVAHLLMVIAIAEINKHLSDFYNRRKVPADIGQ